MSQSLVSSNHNVSSIYVCPYVCVCVYVCVRSYDSEIGIGHRILLNDGAVTLKVLERVSRYIERALWPYALHLQ